MPLVPIRWVLRGYVGQDLSQGRVAMMSVTRTYPFFIQKLVGEFTENSRNRGFKRKH